jgi:hypothetical protein
MRFCYPFAADQAPSTGLLKPFTNDRYTPYNACYSAN